MTTNFYGASKEQMELDLLDAIAVDDLPYLWNPLDQETETCLDDLCKEFRLEDLPQGMIENGSKNFFAQLENVWSLNNLKKSLGEKFGERAPENILNKLAEIVISLGERGNLAEQLVNCVGQIFPQWNLEDLQVLARPLVYAMRSSQNEDAVTSSIATVRMIPWEQLSEVEQARLSLAMTRFAFDMKSEKKG